MTEYVKKPVVVKAVQWSGENVDEVLDLPGRITVEGDNLLVDTLEGMMMADVGDWIIVGIAGEVYPCKPEIFDATYEEVSPPSGADAAEPATPADQP